MRIDSINTGHITEYGNVYKAAKVKEEKARHNKYFQIPEETEKSDELKQEQAAREKEESTTDTEILVKPDGSRVLVVTVNIGGMKTSMSLQLSKPTNWQNEIGKENIENPEQETKNSALPEDIGNRSAH